MGATCTGHMLSVQIYSCLQAAPQQTRQHRTIPQFKPMPQTSRRSHRPVMRVLYFGLPTLCTVASPACACGTRPSSACVCSVQWWCTANLKPPRHAWTVASECNAWAFPFYLLHLKEWCCTLSSGVYAQMDGSATWPH